MKPAVPGTKSMPIARQFAGEGINGVLVVVAKDDGTCDLTTFSDSVTTLLVMLGGAMSSAHKSMTRVDDPEGRGAAIADLIEQAMNLIGVSDGQTFDPTTTKAN